jgi:tetratricopeptide (TPR) repeat protein
LGSDSEAIKDYDEAIRLNPYYADAYNNRGTSKAHLGSDSEAIKDYNEAIRLNPYYADTYNNRGNSKADLGSYSEAIKDYDEAIRLNPDFAEAYYNRGNSKARLGSYSEAIKDYDESIRLTPDYAKAFDYRSKSYRQLAEEEIDVARKTELIAKAEDDEKMAKKLYQKQEEEFLKKCSELIKNKDYKYAYTLLTKVIDKTPDCAEAYFYRGICDKEMNNRWKALYDYNKAIQFNNTFKDAYLYRGSLQMELEDYPKAIEDFNKVIELDPKSIDGYFKRAQTYRLMGKEEKDSVRKKELTDLADIDEQKAKSLSQQ